MEQQLENRIAKAFHKKDSAYSYKKKDELWQRIVLLSGKKGVAAFWRVAAVILALITFGGAFAAITVFENGKNKLTESEKINQQLEFVIDSLKNVVPEKIIEEKIIEKEKIVYRDVIKTFENTIDKSAGQNILKDEVDQLTDLLKKTNLELKVTRDSLDFAMIEIGNLNTIRTQTRVEPTKDFRIKPERVKDQMQEIITEPSPKMKLQLFKVPNENVKYNPNATFLKK